MRYDDWCDCDCCGTRAGRQRDDPARRRGRRAGAARHDRVPDRPGVDDQHPEARAGRGGRGFGSRRAGQRADRRSRQSAAHDGRRREVSGRRDRADRDRRTRHPDRRERRRRPRRGPHIRRSGMATVGTPLTCPSEPAPTASAARRRRPARANRLVDDPVQHGRHPGRRGSGRRGRGRAEGGHARPRHRADGHQDAADERPRRDRGRHRAAQPAESPRADHVRPRRIRLRRARRGRQRVPAEGGLAAGDHRRGARGRGGRGDAVAADDAETSSGISSRLG